MPYLPSLNRCSVVSLVTGAVLALASPNAVPAQGTRLGGTLAERQVIYACYSPTDGRLYRIRAEGRPPSCMQSTHVELSWNVEGRPGTRGLTGPMGPTGPTGPAGPAGSSGLAGQTCASGSYVVGFDSTGSIVCRALDVNWGTEGAVEQQEVEAGVDPPGDPTTIGSGLAGAWALDVPVGLSCGGVDAELGGVSLLGEPYFDEVVIEDLAGEQVGLTVPMRLAGIAGGLVGELVISELVDWSAALDATSGASTLTATAPYEIPLTVLSLGSVTVEFSGEGSNAMEAALVSDRLLEGRISGSNEVYVYVDWGTNLMADTNYGGTCDPLDVAFTATRR